jgi:hypothetical protein
MSCTLYNGCFKGLVISQIAPGHDIAIRVFYRNAAICFRVSGLLFTLWTLARDVQVHYCSLEMDKSLPSFAILRL